MTDKVALITGITGQDGSYLTELLLSKNYIVHGLVRRSSGLARPRLDHLYSDQSVYNQRLFLHYADLDDSTTTRRVLSQVRPQELYHLAGQSHVGASFDIPESTCEFTAMGTLRLLEMLRDLPSAPKFLHISSSEIFGRPTVSPQNEKTPFLPVTPYGVAKAFATQMVRVYRESFGMFACNAICYNHESPRRGESFVTRKITRAAARIKLGLDQKVTLGNIDGRRDWGFAGDYVEGMYRILQQDAPDDFVLATGVTHSVRDLLTVAFEHVGLNWQNFVEINAKYQRPSEGADLCGSADLAFKRLGWKPQKSFDDFIRLMVEHDLKQNRVA
jgi:GDPmannose 4,6-dehydratase